MTKSLRFLSGTATYLFRHILNPLTTDMPSSGLTLAACYQLACFEELAKKGGTGVFQHRVLCVYAAALAGCAMALVGTSWTICYPVQECIKTGG